MANTLACKIIQSFEKFQAAAHASLGLGLPFLSLSSLIISTERKVFVAKARLGVPTSFRANSPIYKSLTFIQLDNRTPKGMYLDLVQQQRSVPLIPKKTILNH